MRILENMVFLELRRRGFEVFYFSGKGEADVRTRVRECQGLKEAMAVLHCADGLILTDAEWEDIERRAGNDSSAAVFALGGGWNMKIQSGSEEAA